MNEDRDNKKAGKLSFVQLLTLAENFAEYCGLKDASAREWRGIAR